MKCCICGSTIKGYGNNPWPIKNIGKCCDKCNSQYVIVARLKIGPYLNETKKDV